MTTVALKQYPSQYSATVSSADSLLETATRIANQAALRAASLDCAGAFPAEEFTQLAAAGLLAAPIHPAYGGIGLGFQSDQTGLLLQILKQIGRGNLSLGRVFEGHINGLQLVQTFGRPEQVKALAQDALAAKVFGVWNAEAADGVKIVPIGGDRYRLVGSKTFCSGCGYVERPFVNGALPDGRWQMCIVPMEKVNVEVDASWWQPPGMRASASYKVDFTGVEVTNAALIGQPGDYFRQPWLTSGVVRFAAVQLGGAEALFDATRTYLQGLGRTDHPHQQARLGQMAIALEQGNLWLQGGANKIEQYAPVFGDMPSANLEDTEDIEDMEEKADRMQLVQYCNMVRTAIEQICMDMIQLSERCIGTNGLLPPHPMERIIRDLTLYLRQPAFDASLTGIGEYVLTTKAPARDLWI
ncbi:MAG: Acyl-CoA dehydrogenase [Phormidesmis priestleyi Ana]|uniref:Acyl-CoA dehydrogenase n=1 Tax=Phormidesmis priestleyi Ana TaxID=1666911 RepID=A0A0P7YTD0_9CYAN|nr:MAG: Acyl-CoA dehydrogenase [Phormidesmis priestleyi Ana]